MERFYKMSSFTNEDCMDLMKRYSDKYFELAIVDPPYGINVAKEMGEKSYQQYGKAAAPKAYYEIKEWDSKIPGTEYFKELFRVSQNQIIWGGNYFQDVLGSCRGMIVWDKKNDGNQFADGELAWISIDKPVRFFRYMWNGMLQENMKRKESRIHPTQKPIALYKWLLSKYAKQGDKILDTHVGSASSLIACEDLGFEYVGCELDADYYKAACERIAIYKSQGKLDFD